jgi:hypothetical protein
MPALPSDCPADCFARFPAWRWAAQYFGDCVWYGPPIPLRSPIQPTPVRFLLPAVASGHLAHPSRHLGNAVPISPRSLLVPSRLRANQTTFTTSCLSPHRDAIFHLLFAILTLSLRRLGALNLLCSGRHSARGSVSVVWAPQSALEGPFRAMVRAHDRLTPLVRVCSDPWDPRRASKEHLSISD